MIHINNNFNSDSCGGTSSCSLALDAASQGWMWLACRSRDSATTAHKLFHYVKGNKNYSIFRWVYFMSPRTEDKPFGDTNTHT